MTSHSKAHAFFTKEEREKIKETTAGVEKNTIGEIAVMVVDSSDHYFEAEVIGGILLGAALALIPTIRFFHDSVWFYVPLSFLLFFPSRFLFARAPMLKATVIGRKRMYHAVRLRALRAFYEKDLHRTKENTGVLFFLSLFERKVWVLADSGIHARIEQKTLDRLARLVTDGIKEGRACDALCAAIREAGEILAEHFPKALDDTDELPNEVIC